MELPFLTAAVPGIGGALRTTPEDFRVEELPAYEPSGEGEHLYVRFEKRGLTTPEAVERLARALGVPPREAGYAGLKDRHAVTTQAATFPRADADRALALSLEGIRVLSAARHRNKLRTGHLYGNRFVLRVRGAHPEAGARARAVADALLARGAPNYYGAQRFGRDGDNAQKGLAWLRGERPAPREPFLRKLWVSSVQSEAFNRCLAARVTGGWLDRYLQGDLAVRHHAGPLSASRPFAIDPSEALELYASHGASATGPMPGAEMQQPSGDALALEDAALGELGITPALFARARDLGEGTRRAVRTLVDDLTITEDPEGLVLAFSLPAGGYATAVLREFRKTDDDGLQPVEAGGIQPSAHDPSAPH